MPERVTKEERIVSLAIEKARSAKKELELSLNDNNRSPEKDDAEVVKVKRPKAEEVKDSELIPKNRKTDGYGLAGQESKY
jgi:Tfp pilus assembly protein PilX|tara:strand:+ start:1198 stop:1437 length:240 start_codon:yes stop_codon:yes gene_type:complete